MGIVTPACAISASSPRANIQPSASSNPTAREVRGKRECESRAARDRMVGSGVGGGGATENEASASAVLRAR